jgi:hypothetical protein
MDRTYRPTLAVLFVATLGGFAFAFITGFSIGRFVAVLPLLLTAYAVTYGRGYLLQVAAFVAAIGIYILFAWLIPEQVHYWGIHIETPICAFAYVIAFLRPPRGSVAAR